MMSLKQKSLSAFIPACLFFYFSNAQKFDFPLIYSGKILDTVSTLQQEEKYKEALRYCYSIPANDTNYQEAIYQLAYTHMLQKAYDSCIYYAKTGAVTFPAAESKFLHLAVSGYDYADSADAALGLLSGLIAKYPHQPQLYHSRGAILNKQKKYREAAAEFQKALLINSFFSSAHFSLGELYYKEGDFVSAILAFQTYLLMSPEGKYVSNIVKYLGNLTTITDEIRSLAEQADFSDNRAFEPIQQVLLSSAALSKKYKLKVSLDDNIIRQVQACNELLKYEEGSAHFAMQYYVPFFEKTFREDNFDACIYTMLSGLTIKEVQTWLKKNDKKSSAFAATANEYLNNIRLSRELVYTKRASAPVCYEWYDGQFIGYGPCTNLDVGKYSGSWKVFHPNGVLASEGKFTEKKERDGEWNFYFDNGKQKEKSFFKAGKMDGKVQTWHTNGQPYLVYEMVNGLQEGVEKNYFYNGKLRNESNFTKGKKNGKETSYNYKGYKISEAVYTDAELNGPAVSFYNNGMLKDSMFYKSGLPEGLLERYNRNGATIESGAFLKGQRNGEWTMWYNDGAVSEKTQYLNGEHTGEFTEFHENGTLSRKGKYFKGEIDDMIEDYDEDGKIYSSIEMDKGRVRNISFFDKSGNKTESFSTSKGNIGITFFDPYGVKQSEGNFTKDGLKQGEFTEYFGSGKVSAKKNYKDNMLDGLVTAYFSNGKKKYETQYTADEINGYNIWYHNNGNKRSEGWFVNGVKQQFVGFYDEKGNLTAVDYNLNGEPHGPNIAYFPNGKPQFRQQFYNGWIQKIWQYDSLCKQLSYFDLKDGKGEVVFVYMNGAPYIKKHYENYSLNGDNLVYYSDGSLKSKSTYIHDDLNGPAVWYYPFGKIEEEGTYAFGEKTGVWKSYHSNGQLASLENFKDGEEHGESKTFRTDGTLSRIDHYENGVRQGPSIFYGLKDEVLVQLNYKEGNIISYSYPDAAGKLKAPLMLRKNSGSISAMYPNGKQSVQLNIRENDFHGPIKFFYPDGKPMLEGNYEAGLLNGKRIMYYPDGSIWIEDNFIESTRFGVKAIYDKAGKPMLKETYFAGLLHGECNYYDAAGNLISSYFYYDGDAEKKLK